MNIKEEFRKFLVNINVFDDFIKEVKTHHNIDFDGLFLSGWISKSFPGYFVEDAFPWNSSVTQKKKDAYQYWLSVHWRWKQHLNGIKAPDKSEFIDRDVE